MSLNNRSVAGVRWSVYIIGSRKRLRKKFGDDFAGALEFWEKCRNRDMNVVLHSDNVAFPPPKHITEHPVEKWEVVTRKGKRYKKKVIDHVNLMEDNNDVGIWWCPYCITLLHFKEVERNFSKVTVCPVCEISSRNFAVRQANPKATVIELHKRSRKKRTRRSRAPRIKRGSR